MLSRPPARRHVSLYLCNKKTGLLVEQENMSCCSTRRHVQSLRKKTRLLVVAVQEDVSSSSCATGRHVFWATRARVFLFNQEGQVPWMSNKAFHLDAREDRSSCCTNDSLKRSISTLWRLGATVRRILHFMNPNIASRWRQRLRKAQSNLARCCVEFAV